MPDPRQREFLQKKFPDLVFLEDEWEYGHIRIWQHSIVPTMSTPTVDTQRVFAYCDKFGLDRVDTLEFMIAINMEAYSG